GQLGLSDRDGDRVGALSLREAHSRPRRRHCARRRGRRPPLAVVVGAFRLDGRVALVTGAASGIGAATARVFAQAGADVVAGWYPADPHDVEPTRAAVEEAGKRCVIVEVDVSDTASVDAMVSRAVQEFGRLDIVVAN